MIGLFNLDEHVEEIEKITPCKIVKYLDDLNGVKILLMEYIGRDDPDEEKFIIQVGLIKLCIENDIKLKVFDNNFKLKESEYSWLSRYSTDFFEPRIITRPGFKYCPVPIKILDYSDIPDTERNIDVGFKNDISQSLILFEKYIKNLSIRNTNLKINYSINIPEEKRNEYRSVGINHSEIDWNDVCFTVVIDSYKSFNEGYISHEIFKAMEAGCLPISVFENKYFGTMFYPSLCVNEKDLKFHIESFRDFRRLLIYDIYLNIKKNFPEFTYHEFINKIGV